MSEQELPYLIAQLKRFGIEDIGNVLGKDIVEVVRCKDCHHSSRYTTPNARICFTHHRRSVKDSNFCSTGTESKYSGICAECKYQDQDLNWVCFESGSTWFRETAKVESCNAFEAMPTGFEV